MGPCLPAVARAMVAAVVRANHSATQEAHFLERRGNKFLFRCKIPYRSIWNALL
jgi:hypothetical protein